MMIIITIVLSPKHVHNLSRSITEVLSFEDIRSESRLRVI